MRKLLQNTLLLQTSGIVDQSLKTFRMIVYVTCICASYILPSLLGSKLFLPLVGKLENKANKAPINAKANKSKNCKRQQIKVLFLPYF